MNWNMQAIGAKIWNSVPLDVRKLSKHNLQKKLHEVS